MATDTNLHPIQERILRSLGYDKEKSFTDLKGNIKSNRFSFHLKKLQDEGMIEKKGKKYKNTSLTKEILPYFELGDLSQPVIVVTVLAFSDEKVYLVEKEDDLLDPLSGYYSSPSSKLSKRVRLKDKAQKLIEGEIKEVGKVEEIAVFDGELEFIEGSKQHYLWFFFRTDADVKDDNNWFDISELEDLDLIPGLEKIIKKIKWADTLTMGTWDLKQTEGGFESSSISF